MQQWKWLFDSKTKLFQFYYFVDDMSIWKGKIPCCIDVLQVLKFKNILAIWTFLWVKLLFQSIFHLWGWCAHEFIFFVYLFQPPLSSNFIIPPLPPYSCDIFFPPLSPTSPIQYYPTFVNVENSSSFEKLVMVEVVV